MVIHSYHYSSYYFKDTNGNYYFRIIILVYLRKTFPCIQKEFRRSLLTSNKQLVKRIESVAYRNKKGLALYTARTTLLILHQSLKNPLFTDDLSNESVESKTSNDYLLSTILESFLNEKVKIKVINEKLDEYIGIKPYELI